MSKGVNMHSWTMLPGLAGIVLVVTLMCAYDIATLTGRTAAAAHTALQLPLQHSLRAAFLLIAAGALWQMPAEPAASWRNAKYAATIMLVLGLAAQLADAMSAHPAVAGPLNSLDRRLLRLGSMAAFAIPMMVLLAAREQQYQPVLQRGASSVVALLLRWEPVLFAIGAATLGTILVAGALLHREILWLSPLGADTTIAACAAAAVRAHARHDPLARSGWLLLCLSMTAGLLMGGYSFGGPLPVPGFIGEYGTLTRIILRDSHVILICLGIVCVTLALLRQDRRGAI